MSIFPRCIRCGELAVYCVCFGPYSIDADSIFRQAQPDTYARRIEDRIRQDLKAQIVEHDLSVDQLVDHGAILFRWDEVCLECENCLSQAAKAVESCIRWRYQRQNQHSLLGILLDLGIQI